MTKTSAQKPRRRGRRMPQRAAGAPILTPPPLAESPAEPSPAFIESEEGAELIRKPANQLIERQALEPAPESGEQVPPGEIEETEPARSGEDQTLCGD
jgi:hypothetical protein